MGVAHSVSRRASGPADQELKTCTLLGSPPWMSAVSRQDSVYAGVAVLNWSTTRTRTEPFTFNT